MSTETLPAPQKVNLRRPDIMAAVQAQVLSHYRSELVERIRAEGALSVQDFERAQGPLTDWFGVPTNTVRAVLEAYSLTGTLGLSHRDGNRRPDRAADRHAVADRHGDTNRCSDRTADRHTY